MRAVRCCAVACLSAFFWCPVEGGMAWRVGVHHATNFSRLCGRRWWWRHPSFCGRLEHFYSKIWHYTWLRSPTYRRRRIARRPRKRPDAVNFVVTQTANASPPCVPCRGKLAQDHHGAKLVGYGRSAAHAPPPSLVVPLYSSIQCPLGTVREGGNAIMPVHRLSVGLAQRGAQDDAAAIHRTRKVRAAACTAQLTPWKPTGIALAGALTPRAHAPPVSGVDTTTPVPSGRLQIRCAVGPSRSARSHDARGSQSLARRRQALAKAFALSQAAPANVPRAVTFARTVACASPE
ncbi:hypothetical protein C8Q79DRAFT_106744 [Trametes meyenii]|nr:hypothetical protein C8Q79DRAFT_106744 [Trametes meyenii]